MKIALIGYGKMGKTIEQIALERGHRIVSIIDMDNAKDFTSAGFRSADVAIEFTAPTVAFSNYLQCFDAGIPVVSGTTGWLDRLPEIKKLCDTDEKTFFYASNFSIGVNLFFALNRYLAKMMNAFPDYHASLTETHHVHKLDAPSGTAITLAEGMIEHLDRKSRWTMQTPAPPEAIPIQALREGEIPGIHKIMYASAIDSISIEHSANSRAGFALGAVVAAEFTLGKKGFLSMEDMIKL